jgi:hypothetical protein
MPVYYTVYVQPNDGNLTSPDAISTQTPLQQCLDGNYENVTDIDFLLATYGRINKNTEHFEIFDLKNGKKNILFQTDFSSLRVKDNDYFSIHFQNISSAGKLCFLLTSKDATPENSITYWLNSQSQPVLKLKSTVPLHKAIEQIVGASRFRLPIWLGIALCLLYLLANVSALFLIWHEVSPRQSVSKTPPSHPRRTRQKRI